MNDSELAEALAKLGIGPDALHAVLLLPVVQVAWADGRIQPPERARILDLARGYGLSTEALSGWLGERPDPELLALGREVLVALALRHRGPTSWGPGTLEEVEQHCVDVARAAGGLFGIAFSMEARERKALDELGAAFRRARDQQRDDLPDPDGGAFEEL